MKMAHVAACAVLATVSFPCWARADVFAMPLPMKVNEADLVVIAEVVQVTNQGDYYLVDRAPDLTNYEGHTVSPAYGSWNQQRMKIEYRHEDVATYLRFLEEWSWKMTGPAQGYAREAINQEIGRHLLRQTARCRVIEELKASAGVPEIGVDCFTRSSEQMVFPSPWELEAGKRYILFLKKTADDYELINPFLGATEVSSEYFVSSEFVDGHVATNSATHEDYIGQIRSLVSKQADAVPGANVQTRAMATPATASDINRMNGAQPCVAGHPSLSGESPER